MSALTYIRLIGFTAGTLLQLFWMVVILGYRRQRNFERVLFFLCLSLFLFYAGSLLALNAQVYYAVPPESLLLFSTGLIAAGLCFLPPLVFHLHLEYAATRKLVRAGKSKQIGLTLMYAPVPYFALKVYSLLGTSEQFNILVPGSSLGRSYGIWMMLALSLGVVWEWKFARAAERRIEERFHYFAALVVGASAVLVFLVHFERSSASLAAPAVTETILALTSILPLALLIYLVQRHDFLQIGRQKNLVYAVTVTFLALLYLSLVRRVSTWLEPIFPPEASAAILLFVLVVFFEPLQRLLSSKLQKTAQLEMDRTQKVLNAVQDIAHLGNLERLRQFVETRVQEQYGLAAVSLMLVENPAVTPTREPHRPDGHKGFAIRRADKSLGWLAVQSHGGMLSGETSAAMEFICEQLPTSIDLCRTLEEKLQLERELAERERLALVGQTAASISHNLKNPLGSIKTILQVQLESPDLPESMRGETKMVLDEITRLSAKLNQLLQFSRPAVRSGSGATSCDARVVIEEAAAVLRPQADQRGVTLRVDVATDRSRVTAAPEALNDIASNLLVNALEAIPGGGLITVSGAVRDLALVLIFEDDGPGIPESLRERILQPFFTTKSQGTGLGLAIVSRRVSECDGKLVWQSPARNGRGTRFEITLPLAEETQEAS